MVMGKGQLSGPVESHDEGLEDLGLHVVELVDGDEDAGVVVAGHLAQLGEEPGQVGGQIAGVGRPGDGVDVDGHLRSAREADREGLQDAEGSADPFADPASGVHGQQDPAEGRGQPDGEVPVLVDLEVLVEVAPALGQLLELVQEHRLPHPPEPGEHGRAPVTAEQEALEGDVHGLDLPLPPHQSRRPGPGPGAVGVPDRVHQVSLSILGTST